MASDKLERIRNLIRSFDNECDLTQQFIIPLLSKMGFQGVVYNHGAQEHGKDIVARKPNPPMKDRLYAFIVKRDKISGASSAVHTASNIQQQVIQAFSVPWQNLETNKSETISDVVIIAGDLISQNARTQIHSFFELQKHIASHIEFVGIDKLCEWSMQYWPDAVMECKTDDSELIRALICGCDVGVNPVPLLRHNRHFADLLVDIDVVHFQRGRSSVKNKDIAFKSMRRRMRARDCVEKFSGNIVIIGEPGSGKSTLLSQIFQDQVDKLKSRTSDILPVFVRARDLRPSMEEGLRDDFGSTCINIFQMSAEEKFRLQKKWTSSNRLVFIDALDEIPDEPFRNRLISELEKPSSEQNKSCRFVMTSRPGPFQGGFVPNGFVRLDIQSLSRKSVVQFIQNWFKNQDEICSRIVSALTDSSVAHVLPRTPIVMTLLASILEGSTIKHEIPANVTDLYDLFVDISLERWDLQKEIRGSFDCQLKRVALSRIAAQMQNKRISSIDLSDAQRDINEMFRLRGLTVDCALMLKEVIDRSGLLRINQFGDLEFSHISFQSFFCACETWTDPNISESIAITFADQWWDLVNIFICGKMKDTEKIFASKQFSDQISLLGDDADIDLRIGKNIGLCLQAGFMSTITTKVRWLNEASLRIARSLKTVVAGEWKWTTFDPATPLVVYLVTYATIGSEILGSQVLRSAVETLLTDPTAKFSDEQKFILLMAAIASGIDEDESVVRMIGNISDNRIALISSVIAANDSGRSLSHRTRRSLKNIVRSSSTRITIDSLFRPPNSPKRIIHK